MTHLTTADATELHYEIAGSGAPPMLFVHGWCSNLNHWRRQVQHFARRHRVIALDRRGHGRSAQPHRPRELNAALHAADIAAIAHKEGLRGAIVVGHAGGGPATLEFARTYPELARAVVLVDAGVYAKPRTAADDPFGVRLNGMIQALSSPDGAQRFRDIYATFFGPHADKTLVARAVADAARTPLPIAIAELKQTIGISTQAIARGVKQPVLFVTATAVDQAFVRSALRRVQFAQVAGSGHFVQLEVPAQLNAMIDTFIAQLD